MAFINSSENQLGELNGWFKKISRKVSPILKKTIAPVITQSTKLLSKYGGGLIGGGGGQVPEVTLEPEVGFTKPKRRVKASTVTSTLEKYALPLGIVTAIIVVGTASYFILRKNKK